MDNIGNPEGESPVKPTKKMNPFLRLACAIGVFSSVACGTTVSEQQGVKLGQGMANRDAAAAAATATSKQAEEVRKQVNQTLGQDKPFAER